MYSPVEKYHPQFQKQSSLKVFGLRDHRQHPPKALTDNNDGLTFYRRFSEQFDNLINPGGYMLLEIGGNSQKNSIETIFHSVGLNTKFLIDLQNDWRAVVIRK